MRSRRVAAWVSVVAAVGLATGGAAAAWPTSASASSGVPVIHGHRCTKVTYRPHVTLRGTHGNDVLCGLGGYDTLVGGSGNDVLIGQRGHNTASFSDHVSGLVASLATGLETDPTTRQTDRLIGISNLIGGQKGNDVLVGNTGNNRLTAGGGNDVLEAGSGNDTLVGGSGRDWLIGGTGHNHMLGGSGHDVIDASEGSDQVDCGPGSDVVNTDSSTRESDCQGDQSEELQHYHGTVNAVDTTANTITVQWTHVNDSAQTWLDNQVPPDPNPVTISLDGADIDFGGGHFGDGGDHFGDGGGDQGGQGDNARPSETTGPTGSTGPTGPTIQPNDQVEVEATTGPDGTSLVAVDVHVEGNEQHLQNYHGTVSSVDTTANTITVNYTDVNDAAQTWLDNQTPKDPNPITISLNGANIDFGGGHLGDGGDARPADTTGSTGPGGDGTIQPNDRVDIEATTSPDGTSLIAVNVHVEPNWRAFQFYLGTVTAVDTTANTITVNYTDVNDAAQTWLDNQTPKDPNPIAISLDGANIERIGGGAIQPNDEVVLGAIPDSTGTNLVALDVLAGAVGGGSGST